jgi:uncharacterized protein (DUF362 family)
MTENIVVLKEADYDGELAGKLRAAIEEAGPLAIADGDPLALKINLCDARPADTGAITHPFFLDAVLGYFRSAYPRSELFVVESDGTVAFADEFIRWFGFLPILEKWGAKWFNLSHDRIVRRPVNGLELREVPVPELLTRAKLISLPKMKTNMLTGLTCCLKNQFGCLPVVEKGNYHAVIDKVIADLNVVYRPTLNIVDGILAMGGARGPANGVPIKAKLLLVGQDPVAVDTLAARIMGLDPRRIGHLTCAEKAGAGSMDYTLRGEFIRKDFEINRWEQLQFSLGGKIQDVFRQRFRKSAG